MASTYILKTNDDNSKLTEKRSVQLLDFMTEAERKENLAAKTGGLWATANNAAVHLRCTDRCSHDPWLHYLAASRHSEDNRNIKENIDIGVQLFAFMTEAERDLGAKSRGGLWTTGEIKRKSRCTCATQTDVHIPVDVFTRHPRDNQWRCENPK